jgi:2-dehydro-3-deoxyglucarate aldolase/4-hydroxy-2-oxoheptanedioate aldolase
MPELILSQPTCDPAMLRTFVAAGWRNIMLDLEHNPFSESDIVSASVALLGAGGSPYLKMADLDPDQCARYLKFGVRNFVLPKVQNAASLEAVRARMADVFWDDPVSIRLIPLIESQAAVREIPSICAVDNVAALIVGPGDMARDMGLPFRTIAELEALGPKLTPTLLSALDAIRACGKPSGCGFVSSWFDFFPMDRVDIATLQFVDVAAAGKLVKLWAQH